MRTRHGGRGSGREAKDAGPGIVVDACLWLAWTVAAVGAVASAAQAGSSLAAGLASPRFDPVAWLALRSGVAGILVLAAAAVVFLYLGAHFGVRSYVARYGVSGVDDERVGDVVSRVLSERVHGRWRLRLRDGPQGLEGTLTVRLPTRFPEAAAEIADALEKAGVDVLRHGRVVGTAAFASFR